MTNTEFVAKFNLVNIREEQFSTFLDIDIDNNEINQTVAFGFGADKTNKLIACSCTYTLSAVDRPFIHIQIVCNFGIEEDSWNTLQATSEGKFLLIPNGFATHLGAIVYSTTRGVLYEKTKGTKFEKFPMQLLSVTAIIKEAHIKIAI
ncbi:hypothetical protein GCM10027566_10120 [Arachidicoccus ginsenosidivorans]|uniref:Uncharacterized protein n=1 Tax=Arachidicoccus ginsenosidivorans TaxID=496057 RepID=A0A5B8VKA6_9BACT|nr:hypothetical protein [Arachidicoccus ginsenosidivorans]QEC71930.1 hypothetical protein FSB73_09895 [Arachidicoccus ginsenosidivorans]